MQYLPLGALHCGRKLPMRTRGYTGPARAELLRHIEPAVSSKLYYSIRLASHVERASSELGEMLEEYCYECSDVLSRFQSGVLSEGHDYSSFSAF